MDNYTSLTYSYGGVYFYRDASFYAVVNDYLSDDEYRELQLALCKAPESGVVIPGSGGIRKLRWSMSGRGKRGSLRVIYYLRVSREEIWMLTIYPKNVSENIPAHVLRKIREEIENV